MTILRAYAVVVLTLISTACTPSDAGSDTVPIDARGIDSPPGCTPPADGSPSSDARVDAWPYEPCPGGSLSARCNFGTGYFGQSIDTTCVHVGAGSATANSFCTTPCHDDLGYCPYSNLHYRFADGGPEAGVDLSHPPLIRCARLASECQSFCFVDCSADPLCPAGAHCTAVTIADAGTAMFCMPD